MKTTNARTVQLTIDHQMTENHVSFPNAHLTRSFVLRVFVPNVQMVWCHQMTKDTVIKPKFLTIQQRKNMKRKKRIIMVQMYQSVRFHTLKWQCKLCLRVLLN